MVKRLIEEEKRYILKKNKIMNSALISQIASIGHTQLFVIGDVGLPVPKGVKVIDLSLISGIPSFMDVLKAVDSELVYEKVILASEIKSKNRKLLDGIFDVVSTVDIDFISHDEFKTLTKEAEVIVRTGEMSPFANIILVAGVNF